MSKRTEFTNIKLKLEFLKTSFYTPTVHKKHFNFLKKTDEFAAIHNGPVLQIERNPFIADVILSIGQKIVAVWYEHNQSTPLLWRRRESIITCCQWSPSRISLFFLARQDGFIELWDLLTRTDDATISHDTGRLIITVVTQHKLNMPTDILLAADQKANLRIFTMPTSISRPKTNDFNVTPIYFI